MHGRGDAPFDDEGEQERGVGRGTDRLSPTNSDWSSEGDPVNPGWRSERSRSTTRRRAARRPSVPQLPTNTADAMVWLQRGGWRWLALAAGALLLLIVIFALRGSPSTASTTDDSAAPLASQIARQPTVTLPPVQPTAAPPSVQAYVVSGTDVQGLILRSGPGTENQALKTLPEGTRIEFLGEEQQGGDYVWLRVRDPEGTEGWVARDFTQPAQ